MPALSDTIDALITTITAANLPEDLEYNLVQLIGQIGLALDAQSARPQGEWTPVEDGYGNSTFEIEDGGESIVVYAGQEYAKRKLPPDIRLCRRAPVAMQTQDDDLAKWQGFEDTITELRRQLRALQDAQTQGEGMDAPDGPGWWAFEGVVTTPVGLSEKLYWVVDVSLNSIDKNMYAHSTSGHSRPVKAMSGTWTCLHMPWDATPPATVMPAQGVGILTDEEYAAFNLFMFYSGKYGYMVSWLNGDGDEPFEPHFMDVIAAWWDKQQRPLAAKGE